MKKAGLIIGSIVVMITLLYGSLLCINKIYDLKITKYYDIIGNALDLTKNQGMILQKQSLNRQDNFSIYGSSELSGVMIPSHPINFFKDKKDGFEINLVGRGYCQSLVDAINFGALSNDLKGKKVAIILSPQWFTESGLTAEQFDMNSSELQFYAFMFNKNIDKNLKLRLAKRVNSLIVKTSDFQREKIYAYLYSKNNFMTDSILVAMSPYYKVMYNLLQIKDKIKTEKLLKKYENNPETIPVKKQTINWNDEFSQAETLGEKNTTNNSLGILNDYYNTYIKQRMPSLKDSYKDTSYTNSPEYDDLKLLLDLCKSQGIKPLIIGVPVHGEWYDYCGFPKERREEYYKKVSSLINNYGFDYEDLSSHEYEKYFLKDIMHLGWKGWLYVDEAISRYYHQN